MSLRAPWLQMSSKARGMFCVPPRFIIMSLLSLAALRAQQSVKEQITFHATVRLVVSTDNGLLRSQVLSYCGRELRSLGDLDIDEIDPDYEIDIVAMTQSNQAGKQIGIALSDVVLRPKVIGKNAEGLLPMVASESNPQVGIRKFLNNSARFENHALFVGPPESVKARCQDLVVNADTQVFAPMRTLFREMQQALRNRSDPTKRP